MNLSKKKETAPLTGEITPAEIQALKDEHGEINGVIAGGHIAYFRRVTRADVNIATSQIDRDTAMDFNYYVMRECKVAGSDEVLENDQKYLSAQSIFKGLIEGEKAELVKF